MSTAFSHAPEDIFRRVLIAVGVGAAPETVGGTWPIYATREPTSPDNVITVYGTSGTTGGRLMNTGQVLRNYGVQIRIRADGPRTGMTKSESIRHTLEEGIYQETVTLGGVAYSVHACSGIGEVIPIGPEPGSRRELFTINCMINVRRIS